MKSILRETRNPICVMKLCEKVSISVLNICFSNWHDLNLKQNDEKSRSWEKLKKEIYTDNLKVTAEMSMVIICL